MVWSADIGPGIPMSSERVLQQGKPCCALLCMMYRAERNDTHDSIFLNINMGFLIFKSTGFGLSAKE
jgi:hypothetical protein